MFGRLKQLLEMIRFSHTVFALPFALLAAVMAWTAGAQSDPATAWRWQELLGIILCMVTGRSVAMALNRIADRRIDAENPRTAGRHLPSGAISLGSAVAFAIVCGTGFVLSTLLFLPNRLPVYLAIPVLAFLWGYSYTKRFTWLAHFWLGAVLMLAPVSAWVAIRGAAVLAGPSDLLPAWVLGGAVMLWVAGFDMIYACQDAEFDVRRGLQSVPARWSVRGALRAAAACHAGTLVLLLLLPWAFPYLGWLYTAGVLGVAMLLIYEHAVVRPDDLTRVNVAFFQVNAIISIGLLVVGAIDLWM